MSTRICPASRSKNVKISTTLILPFLSALSEHSQDSTLGFTARDPAKNSIVALNAVGNYLFADADRAAILASVGELADHLEHDGAESDFDRLITQCARVVLMSDVIW